MGMYPLESTPADSQLWQLIAFCAGTGGSLLVIGSAAGVALMGLEKVDFLWYAKRVSVAALAGYAAGIGTYLAQTGAVNQIMGNAAVASTDILQQALPGALSLFN